MRGIVRGIDRGIDRGIASGSVRGSVRGIVRGIDRGIASGSERGSVPVFPDMPNSRRKSARESKRKRRRNEHDPFRHSQSSRLVKSIRGLNCFFPIGFIHGLSRHRISDPLCRPRFELFTVLFCQCVFFHGSFSLPRFGWLPACIRAGGSRGMCRAPAGSLRAHHGSALRPLP